MNKIRRLLSIYARYGFVKGKIRLQKMSYAQSLQNESNRFRALMLIQRLHVQRSEDFNADLRFIGMVMGYRYVKKITDFKLPEMNKTLPNYGLVKGEA